MRKLFKIAYVSFCCLCALWTGLTVTFVLREVYSGRLEYSFKAGVPAHGPNVSRSYGFEIDLGNAWLAWPVVYSKRRVNSEDMGGWGLKVSVEPFQGGFATKLRNISEFYPAMDNLSYEAQHKNPWECTRLGIKSRIWTCVYKGDMQ